MSRSSPGFLHDVHAFRGFAIINIVAIHVHAWLSVNLKQTVPAVAIDNTVHIAGYIVGIIAGGSTIYFAMISGLLFSRVLVRRGWRRFFRSKLLNVILPYAVMTLLFSLIWWDEGTCGYRESCIGNGLIIHFDGSVAFAQRYLSNVLFGTVISVYWYIPILACLFLATPFLHWLGRRAPWSLLVIATLPLVVSRTGATVSIQSVIFMMGVYAAGMYLGMDYERNLALLTKRLWAIIVVTIIAHVMVPIIFLNDWVRIGSIDVGVSLSFVLRLCYSVLMLILLNRWKDRLPGFLDKLATHAFAIYFIHALVLLPFVALAMQLYSQPITLAQYGLSFVVILVAVLAISVFICMGFRAVLGPRSRMLTGT